MASDTIDPDPATPAARQVLPRAAPPLDRAVIAVAFVTGALLAVVVMTALRRRSGR